MRWFIMAWLLTIAAPCEGADTRLSNPQLRLALQSLAVNADTPTRSLIGRYLESTTSLDSTISRWRTDSTNPLRLDLLEVPERTVSISLPMNYGLIISNLPGTVRTPNESMVYFDRLEVVLVERWLHDRISTMPLAEEAPYRRALQLVEEQRTRGLVFAAVTALGLYHLDRGTVVATAHEYVDFSAITKVFGLQSTIDPGPGPGVRPKAPSGKPKPRRHFDAKRKDDLT